MSTQTLPKQKQEHQPGRETEMRPQPDYEPKYPGCRRLRDKVADYGRPWRWRAKARLPSRTPAG